MMIINMLHGIQWLDSTKGLGWVDGNQSDGGYWCRRRVITREHHMQRDLLKAHVCCVPCLPSTLGAELVVY